MQHLCRYRIALTDLPYVINTGFHTSITDYVRGRALWRKLKFILNKAFEENDEPIEVIEVDYNNVSEELLDNSSDHFAAL